MHENLPCIRNIQYQGLIDVIFSSHLNTLFTRATDRLFVGCNTRYQNDRTEQEIPFSA